jgi:hypothetical protein
MPLFLPSHDSQICLSMLLTTIPLRRHFRRNSVYFLFVKVLCIRVFSPDCAFALSIAPLSATYYLERPHEAP